jgi:hypothetical protein
MSKAPAVTRIARPFGSSSLAGRRWVKFADIGFAAVVVGAGAAFLTAGASGQGDWTQLLMFALGLFLVVIGLALAIIGAWTSKPATEKPLSPRVGWHLTKRQSDAANEELARQSGGSQQSGQGLP